MNLEVKVSHLEDNVERLEKSVESLTEVVSDLTKDNIRTDEKYKNLITMMTNLTSGFTELSKTVNTVLIDMSVNNRDTKKNTNFIEGITVGKIVAITVGIITIVSFVRNG